MIDLETTTQDHCRLRTKKGFKQAGFQERIPQELLKYLKQQDLSLVPLLPAVQETQNNMDDVLSRNDLRKDEKAKRYFQFQSRPNIKFIHKILRQQRQHSQLPLRLNAFNVTPKLTQAAILQKPEKKKAPPLNPAFLTPPSTVETPSQVPKSKRRQSQTLQVLHGRRRRGLIFWFYWEHLLVASFNLSLFSFLLFCVIITGQGSPLGFSV